MSTHSAPPTDVSALALEASVQAIPTSPVASVQRGTITIATNNTSGTATITAVDTSKAYVVFGGFKVDANMTDDDERRWFASVRLTNSTTVTAERGVGANDGAVTVAYAVVELQ